MLTGIDRRWPRRQKGQRWAPLQRSRRDEPIFGVDFFKRRSILSKNARKRTWRWRWIGYFRQRLEWWWTGFCSSRQVELNETNGSQNRGRITPKSCLKAYVNENFKAFFRRMAANYAAKLRLLDARVMGCMDHRRVRRWLAGVGLSCEGSNVRDCERERRVKKKREKKKKEIWCLSSSFSYLFLFLSHKINTL